MILFAIIWIPIVLGVASCLIFDRWCIHKEEMFRMEAQLEEVRCCYDSEQSFMTLEDDPEHIASISVAVLPSMTEVEIAEAKRELEDDVDYARHGRGE